MIKRNGMQSVEFAFIHICRIRCIQRVSAETQLNTSGGNVAGKGDIGGIGGKGGIGGTGGMGGIGGIGGIGGKG